MGSFSGVSVVSPMLSTYSGTKAFLSSFTGALNEEVRGRGVDVECVNTYFVVRLDPSTPSLLTRSPKPIKIFAGLQHVENPPRERAHPPAQGVRP